MDAFASARLADRIQPERAVATTMTRGAILEAIEEDSLPELLLDVTRLGADGSEERGRISITWSRDELEQLLEDTGSEHVRLTFDGGDLAAAFADVEAHGIRERAALVGVAAAAALATTGGMAAAMPDPAGTGPMAAPAAPAANATLTDVSSGGGYAAPAASAADAAVTDVSSAGGYAAPAAAALSDTGVTDVSSSGGYPQPEPVAADSDGGWFRAPTPAEDGLAGALALTIAAAAFASRRRGSLPRPV